MLQNRRKFNRFDSSFFIEFRPLKEVASYFLGLTTNISCEGFSFAFQNGALEPGQRLQFKLKHPRSKLMLSFLGDVIWQEQKDIKFSAGVKFYDLEKKNKKMILKVISDSCNIPVDSLLISNDTGQLLSNERISRIPNRYKSKFSGLYKTAIILATTAAVLFMPVVLDNVEDGSITPITEFIKSMEINNTNKMKDNFIKKNSQMHNRDIQKGSHSVQLQTVENSNSIEVLEENIPSAVKEKELDIKRPENIRGLTGENKYYIQVASFKDPDIAHGILSELKQDYPAAYIFPHNDFYKVRIPDIKTSGQGYDLLKEIEMKFNIKPILVERVQ